MLSKLSGTKNGAAGITTANVAAAKNDADSEVRSGTKNGSEPSGENGSVFFGHAINMPIGANDRNGWKADIRQSGSHL